MASDRASRKNRGKRSKPYQRSVKRPGLPKVLKNRFMASMTRAIAHRIDAYLIRVCEVGITVDITSVDWGIVKGKGIVLSYTSFIRWRRARFATVRITEITESERSYPGAKVGDEIEIKTDQLRRAKESRTNKRYMYRDR